MSEHGIGFAEYQHTVILIGRDVIDRVIRETGVNTLRGFNTVARHLVDMYGKTKGIIVKEGDENKWALGTMLKDDAEYLTSFLKDGEKSEVVDILKI